MSNRSLRRATALLLAGLAIFASSCSSPPVTPQPATEPEKEYAEWFETTWEDIDQSYKRFNEWVQAAQADPKSIDTIQSRLELARELTRWQIYYEECQGMQAPTSLAGVHKEMTKALKEFSAVVDLFTGKTQNADAMALLVHLASAQKAHYKASELFHEWKQAHIL